MNQTAVYLRRTKPTFTNALIPAIAMLLVGAVLMTKILLLGLFLILSALFFLTMTEGLEIDFVHGRIRIFSGFFGMRFGTWEALPAIARITLVPITTKINMSSRTNLTTEVSFSNVQVRLYPQGSAEYYIASMGKIACSRSDAVFLARQFAMSYEDYTL
jgi:hypothetical protein